MILFNHYFSKRTLAFIGVLVLAIALPLILIVVRQQQEIRQRASGGQVMLRLTPDSTTKTIGAPLAVQALLDASSQNITGVDIRLHFDPNVLELTGGDPAPLFNTELVRTVDNNAGTIRYAAVNTANTAITGTVDLGTLHFRTKNTGSAAITIDANPQIAALGSPTLLTVDTTNTSVEVIPPPTPSPVPTETPIPTIPPPPTIQPSPTPTLAPGEPTFTPSPITPTAAPSATPALQTPGDANGDNTTDFLDFNIWKDEYLNVSTNKATDFNHDNVIDFLDFNIWKDAYLGTL